MIKLEVQLSLYRPPGNSCTLLSIKFNFEKHYFIQFHLVCCRINFYPWKYIWLKLDLSLPPSSLICKCVRSEEKPLWATCKWPYVPSNENGDWETMKVLLNCFAYYEQSDWLKNVITIFIISLYIHDKSRSNMTRNEISLVVTYQ